MQKEGRNSTGLRVLVACASVQRRRLEDYGGVAYMSSGKFVNITISDSVISHNTAQQAGGVVEMDSGTSSSVTISNSIVAYNSAQELGGAVDIWAGQYSSLTISNSKVVHNTAEIGGVVYMDYGSSNHVAIRGCTLSNNTAQVSGGIASTSGSHGNAVMISNSDVSDNSAQISGGALNVRNGQLDIINSTLDRNTAQNGGALAADESSEVRVVSSSFSRNTGTQIGGACFISSSRLHVDEGAKLHSNQASAGGAVAIVGESGSVLSGVTVEHNSATLGAAIFASESSVSAMGSAFAMNIAELSGGVLFALQSKLVMDGGCSLISNEARDGGGVVLFHTEAAVTNSVITNNSVTSAGGGLYVDKSNVTLEHVLVEGCYAASQGGGLYVAGVPSQVEIKPGSVISRCTAGLAGGGIQVSTGASLSADQVLLTANMANKGGGVGCNEEANVLLHRCSLVNNTANTAGGGLWGATGCQTELSESNLTRNEVTAGDGGAVYLASTVETGTRVEGSRFEDNSAQQGAAIFLQYPPHHQHVLLRGLHFRQNVAVVGANIFWEYRDQSLGLECRNCTHAPSTQALLASSAKTFGLTQGGGAVEAAINALSGVPFTPEVAFVAYDFYGNMTRLVQDQNDVVVQAADAGVLLDGSTKVAYASEGATFDDLAMIGYPGRQFNLTFQAQAAQWKEKGSISILVHLEPCRAGERHLEDANLCERCEPGTVKFSNSSRPCTNCAGTALTCHGGSSYTLKDDWWMAEDSIRQECTQPHRANDMEECAIERTHECDLGDACRSAENRSNAADEMYVQERLLCAEDRRRDVALCGSCAPGGYTMSVDGHCDRCPSDPWRVWIQPIALTLLMLVLLLVAWEVRKGFLRAAANEGSMQDELRETAEAQADAEEAKTGSRGVVSIWGGWLQVSAQAMHIYDRDVIPGLCWDLLVGLDVVVNVRLFDWVGLDCLMFTMLGGNSDLQNLRDFYWSFSFYASIPLVLLPLSFRVAYRILTSVDIPTVDQCLPHDAAPVQREQARHYSGSRETGDADEIYEPELQSQEPSKAAAADKTVRELQHEAASPATHETGPGQKFLIISVFVLTFIQPTVATYMFQVFNCDPIYHETVEAQYFLVIDRRIECFSTVTWWVIAGIAVFVILTYVVGMPIGMLFVLRHFHRQKRVTDEHGRTYFVPAGRLRSQEAGPPWLVQLSPKDGLSSRPALRSSPVQLVKAPVVDPAEAGDELLNAFNMLDLPIFQSYFGVMYTPFRRKFYWMTSYEMLRRLFQSSFIILIRLADRRADLFFALFVANTSTVLQAYAHPFQDQRDNFLQTIVLFSQGLVAILFIATKYASADITVDTLGGGLMLVEDQGDSTPGLVVESQSMKMPASSQCGIQIKCINPQTSSISMQVGYVSNK
ncbi:hypothetical protein CYMTET_5114 [Cymbomonas tetramitiformis]|uniref:Right handed beta helix domain-containing protein n=1 Tax=Cymbomonas tetramitiformis TaxID=36881 RepID=A0AAE0LJE2_9CHLO|nr:hypothetical protein CYMTET_5114 [Cymbomonas tetramitiformis]